MITPETAPDIGRGSPLSQRADDGSLIVLTDVIGDPEGQLAASLITLHETEFPKYPFFTPLLRDRTGPSASAAQVQSHQWLLEVDGVAAGYVVFDSNLHRRVAIVHFVHLDPTVGALKVAQRRSLAWLYRMIIEQLANDCGNVPVLGAVGEAPRTRAPIFRLIGMRDLGIEYYEPKNAPRWQGPGSELRRLHLLWLPPEGIEPATIEGQAREAGAAAFLLDHYRFDADIAWVASAVGAERTR